MLYSCVFSFTVYNGWYSKHDNLQCLRCLQCVCRHLCRQAAKKREQGESCVVQHFVIHTIFLLLNPSFYPKLITTNFVFFFLFWARSSFLFYSSSTLSFFSFPSSSSFSSSSSYHSSSSTLSPGRLAVSGTWLQAASWRQNFLLPALWVQHLTVEIKRRNMTIAQAIANFSNFWHCCELKFVIKVWLADYYRKQLMRSSAFPFESSQKILCSNNSNFLDESQW